MRRILIRCDASAAIGTGHVMRCLTLAGRLAGHSVTFACAEIGAPLVQRIDDAGYAFVPLRGPRGSQHDLAALLPLIGEADGIVIDGYAFDENYRRAIRSQGRPVLALDDIAETPLHADMVVNPSPVANTFPYDPAAHLLLGPDYALIAGHLLDWRQAVVPRTAPLLISFGGSDPLGLSLPVAAALRRALPEAPLRVVLGGAVASAADVACELVRLDVPVDRDVAQMGPVLRGCRLAVSAAGSTLYELAALGRPMVAVVVADNQDAAARRADAEGWAVCLEGRAPDAVERMAEQTASLWHDEARLRRLGNAAALRVDGLGAYRVADAFLSLLS